MFCGKIPNDKIFTAFFCGFILKVSRTGVYVISRESRFNQAWNGELIMFFFLQISPDGNVSTTTVIFIPDESDQGKFLSCRAENVQLSSSAVEDQWKLEVHCE